MSHKMAGLAKLHKSLPLVAKAHSGLRQLMTSKNPFKSDEKCFLSHLKSSFCSQDIQTF